LAIESGGVLRHLLHLKLLSEGVLAPRGAFNFSAVMTESDLDLVLDALDRALEWLEPAIRTLAPK
jgi:hypothetical protein